MFIIMFRFEVADKVKAWAEKEVDTNPEETVVWMVFG